MILFKKEHAPLILSGRKIETRRLGRKRWNVGSVHQAKLNYYVKPFTHLLIEAVHYEPLGAITEEGAYREGYDSIADYIKAWERIYKWEWDPEIGVWVVRFKLVEEVGLIERGA